MGSKHTRFKYPNSGKPGQHQSLHETQGGFPYREEVADDRSPDNQKAGLERVVAGGRSIRLAAQAARWTRFDTKGLRIDHNQ